MGPDHYGWGGGWMFPMIMPIIMFIIALIVVYLLLGRGGARSSGGNAEPESAMEILKKRYARGEITKEEFDRMKTDLEN
ncbi:MAG: SHOCT domain-containing protein [Deltaproteobacteria bacterium]|nr:SHOCT domain-containing protein [Deltaproteobacteria bacterium]